MDQQGIQLALSHYWLFKIVKHVHLLSNYSGGCLNVHVKTTLTHGMHGHKYSCFGGFGAPLRKRCMWHIDQYFYNCCALWEQEKCIFCPFGSKGLIFKVVIDFGLKSAKNLLKNGDTMLVLKINCLHRNSQYHSTVFAATALVVLSPWALPTLLMWAVWNQTFQLFWVVALSAKMSQVLQKKWHGLI